MTKSVWYKRFLAGLNELSTKQAKSQDMQLLRAVQ